MNIAIVGGTDEKRSELEQLISSIFNMRETLKIVSYELDEQEKIPISENISIAFIVVESSKILHRVKDLIESNSELSAVIVSKSPDYALESIRLNAKYYVLYPYERKEIEEALERSGVIL